MNEFTFHLIYLERFTKEAKKLAKKYPSFAGDLNALLTSLAANPLQGVRLRDEVYKIRMAIKSKNKGKSGGARVITLVRIVESTVYLLTVYDKSAQENLSDADMDALLAQSEATDSSPA
jgi:mRNA-degrading endonuclease RelE of RelBE toxin-antitoxin system